MKNKWLLVTLLLVIFLSGCVGQEDDETVKPTYNDNAIKMEIKIREKEEQRRILPGSTIRMVVDLANQVENETEDVYLTITNPYGIHISKVDCGFDCVCEWDEGSNPEYNTMGGCNEDIECSYNGCYYRTIQSLDKTEITYGLKIPSEEEISQMGRDLTPKIVLEYKYRGSSILYIPIYRYGEEPVDPQKEFTQTTGPIHVDIDSDKWVRSGDLFPVYIDVKDVVMPSEELTIENTNFLVYTRHVGSFQEGLGRCDFDLCVEHDIPDIDCSVPDKNITIPLKNPLVCTLQGEEDITAPMVKGRVEIDYWYNYKIEKTETVRVEKAFLRIF